MTEVVATDKDGLHTLTVNGHSTGSVQVCAGVSALVTMLHNWLIVNAECVDLTVVSNEISDAHAEFIFEGGDDVFYAVVLGFSAIQKNYEKFLSFRYAL